MNIRIEASSSVGKNISGIGFYTKRLANSLAEIKGNTVRASYFNFLNHHIKPIFHDEVITEPHTLLPLRIYAKLQSHRLALPFDMFMKPVDVTIFPNYAKWPTVRSKFTITAVHDLTYIHYPELIEKNNLPHLRRVVPRSIKKSDLILTVSESTKSELVKLFGIDPDRIVATTVPPDDKFLIKNNNEIHKKYSIPTKKYIFFISNIEPRKNLPLLIKAYSNLPGSVTSEYSLVISGGMGWKSDESINAIKTAQKNNLNVVYTGYIDEQDKSALYQNASLFVMPSIYEGFGMPILEAIASKVPVVATDIPVLRESGGEGALYFKPNDANSLTSIIKTVLTDQNVREKLIHDGKKHLKKFSWEHNAMSVMAAISNLGKKNL